MLSFFPRGVLDEILNLTESVSEGFPSYSYNFMAINLKIFKFQTSRSCFTFNPVHVYLTNLNIFHSKATKLTLFHIESNVCSNCSGKMTNMVAIQIFKKKLLLQNEKTGGSATWCINFGTHVISNLVK